MPKDETPSGSGKAPKLSPFLNNLPHHERRFLKALALIIESGKASTVAELIKYCQQARETGAIDFIRNLAEQDLPVDLVFDAMCVHFRIVAHKRNNSLFERCQGKSIGLVLPLPPHVMDIFLHLEKLSVLLPDSLHVPPNVERFQSHLIHGTRSSRTKASDLEVVVFEVFREKNSFYFAPGTGDLVDARILKDDVLLIVHVRPHRDPDDIPVPFPADQLQIL